MSNHADALFADKQIGFFIYLMVEGVMFGTLFATYFVFTPAATGPAPGEVYDTQSVILASACLLTSSGTLMIAEKGLANHNWRRIWTGLGVTFLLGTAFLVIEVQEFYFYVQDGYTLTSSNFLSAFFVLVGLHASHVLFGLLWMVVLACQSFRSLPYQLFKEKHKIFIYYWHFVDLIWILILVLVYAPFLW
ncbi:cytochrome c oxidase subunit 3 [Sediminibacillus albus]|uniref:Cytochrome c oxidase subunit 3 n=1 Tax=Sediminibacillus albus TaxID=407036 RepID=A0A1G8ZQ45_9BACI|nr:cytochrome c oxidase subunit 3 [Sediminibacillus albus]SDK16465.1 cytochrome c oxidase subunit 3 [Sediminibacillus albus]